jgi:hypothetical protein
MHIQNKDIIISAEVEEREELYLYSYPGPSWFVLG